MAEAAVATSSWARAHLAYAVLTIEGTRRAVAIGAERVLAERAAGLRVGKRPECARWGEQIERAGAELALATMLGEPWKPQSDVLASLVGEVAGVRVIWSEGHTDPLVVRRSDLDEEILVLVTGRMPHYVVRGWALAGWAKEHEEWRRDIYRKPTTWRVPLLSLNPLMTLPGKGNAPNAQR